MIQQKPENKERQNQVVSKSWFVEPSLGCTIAGIVGLVKALGDSQSAKNVFVYLLASVVAFVAAYYVRDNKV
jgi:hypothetical protein